MTKLNEIPTEGQAYAHRCVNYALAAYSEIRTPLKQTVIWMITFEEGTMVMAVDTSASDFDEFMQNMKSRVTPAAFRVLSKAAKKDAQGLLRVVGFDSRNHMVISLRVALGEERPS
jgi:hypothetical protein